MAKRMKKGEKLDLILSELSALKSEVARLAKQHGALMAELTSLKSRRAPKRPSSKSAKKAPPPAKAAAKPGQPRKAPVLVQAENPVQPASRASSS
jgi:regulator of replication initiation timing